MSDENRHQFAVRVRITGRVHGVWYRAWARENAVALGLNGWVRNLRDGSARSLFADLHAASRPLRFFNRIIYADSRLVRIILIPK